MLWIMFWKYIAILYKLVADNVKVKCALKRIYKIQMQISFAIKRHQNWNVVYYINKVYLDMHVLELGRYHKINLRSLGL